jgi:hypothetical protein
MTILKNISLSLMKEKFGFRENIGFTTLIFGVVFLVQDFYQVINMLTNGLLYFMTINI